MVMGNKRTYFKNWLISGSKCMYHIENSIMGHVTNNATGTNIIEK